MIIGKNPLNFLVLEQIEGIPVEESSDLDKTVSYIGVILPAVQEFKLVPNLVIPVTKDLNLNLFKTTSNINTAIDVSGKKIDDND